MIINGILSQVYSAKADKSLVIKIHGQNKSDSSLIDIVIINKSNSNYYLPILSADYTSRIINTNDSNLISFFSLETICKKSNNEIYRWNKDFEFHEGCWNPNQDNAFDTQILDMEDIYLLRANDSITSKIAINLSVQLPNCQTLKLADYDYTKTIKISLKYNKKDELQENDYLNPKVVNSLHASGYKLYCNEFVSNEFLFHVSQKDIIRYRKENEELSSIKLSSINRLPGYGIPHNSLQYKYFNRIIPGLTQLNCKNTYPCNDVNELVSLRFCFDAFIYPELKDVIFNRIVEIARLNFKNKVFLKLIEGEQSEALAEQQNKKNDTKHRLIYISIRNSQYDDNITKCIELYNAETERLIKKL